MRKAGDPGRRRERVGVEGAGMVDLFLAGRLGDLEVEQVEDVLAPGDRAARQAAGEDLRQRRQVGPDAVGLLRAAGRDAEAVDHLVEDQQDAVLGGEPAQRVEEIRGRSAACRHWRRSAR